MTVGDKPHTLSIRELWALLDNTVFAVSRLREIELSQFGLTIAQTSILYTLQNTSRPMTLQEFERNGLRQHHSVSTLINRMASLGLVNKVKDPESKRFQIALSNEGRDLCSKLTTASLKMAFSVLSSQQKRELITCLMPLQNRARYLLGMNQTTPFLLHIDQQVANGVTFSSEISPDIDLDMYVWILLDRVGFAMSRLRDLELARFGLTTPQASILYALQSRNGEMTLQEIENKRMRQHHSLFILINRMINMGLITQVKNTKDKKYRIRITPEGVDRYNKLTIASLEMTFPTLTPEQEQQLTANLKVVLERARYLLGVSYMPPFLQYLMENDTEKKQK